MDDKAAVRKAGLQLLEALLMMRARGAGGADVELPAEQDIRALEAATADALVRPASLPCFRLLLRAVSCRLSDRTLFCVWCTCLWACAACHIAHDLAGEHSVSLHGGRAA